MNIAFVNSTRIWSGVKTWMLEFGAELKALGDRPAYFGSDPRFIEEARGVGHPAFLLRFGFDYHPGTIAWFRRRFRELGTELACLNIQKELRTAGIAARLAGIPVVHRVGLASDLSGKWDQRLTHRLVVSRILVPGRTMREQLLVRCPWIRPERITVIPNGKRVNGRPHSARHAPVRFVIASRLDPAKRHEDLLEALGGLTGQVLPDWSLEIYGEGSRREALAAQTRALGLEGRVRFLGFQRDLAARLADYDFGLLTSASEGLPNTVLEYLAAGLPTVATDTGGTAEVLEEGRTGWLYSPGDVTALRECLFSALTVTEARYAECSASAVEVMEREYNPARLAGRLHEFFAEVAAKPPTG
jgi:glycosyltransferase involved in cell wall biosynthesis